MLHVISIYHIDLECEPSVNDEYLSKSTTIMNPTTFIIKICLNRHRLTSKIDIKLEIYCPKISGFSAIELRFAGIHEKRAVLDPLALDGNLLGFLGSSRSSNYINKSNLKGQLSNGTQKI